MLCIVRVPARTTLWRMPARRLDQITDPDAVRRACAEFDEIGQEQFLTKYGFGRARSYELCVEGRR